jgi:hypothetical protein
MTPIEEEEMEGFEVISINDEKCIGHVVERSGDNLIVEHGHLRHHKNALPLAFAEIDEANERVTTTLSAHMVHESPAVNGDGVDEAKVAEYYGLGGVGAEGYGDTSAGEAGAESWVQPTTPATEERAAARNEVAAGEGANDHAGAPAPDSPALLGDRTS